MGHEAKWRVMDRQSAFSLTELIVGLAILGLLLSLVLPLKTVHERLQANEDGEGNVATAAAFLECWLRKEENFPLKSISFFVARDTSGNWAVFTTGDAQTTKGFEVSVEPWDDPQWPPELRYARITLKDRLGRLRVEYPAVFRRP
jgi:prepilin-type N-terminal cleavage/methylation domain-containing protein